MELFDGIDFIVIAIGVFGFAEIIANLEKSGSAGVTVVPLTRLRPTREDFRRSWGAVLRGTGVGTFLGLLPGGGATLASFSAYSLEKRVSRHPEKFGTGVVEGVASPEAANNAAAQSSFIPLLTLGIPSNNMMTMMLSAFMIHGITPGPSVLTNQPEIFWGLVASMWIGNLMLVVINLPMIGLWVKLLTVPYRLLYPAILLFCCIGVYSMNNRIFDVVLAAGFGTWAISSARRSESRGRCSSASCWDRSLRRTCEPDPRHRPVLECQTGPLDPQGLQLHWRS